IFEKHPEIKEIKEELYRQGAIYASMSGSGSSVYGIFSQEVHLQELFKEHFYWADFLQ
ncbi:MAG: 4-(cytidine 5'-diphospho)-2-C-methyl-D-erythritol kinase, partial [Bacteroidales bacterium]|nr:4-(cytidine 5'-diphospho)-2-C-methyl-D-erythritol kinase [Bacteroidales bacterium]